MIGSAAGSTTIAQIVLKKASNLPLSPMDKSKTFANTFQQMTRKYAIFLSVFVDEVSVCLLILYSSSLLDF